MKSMLGSVILGLFVGLASYVLVFKVIIPLSDYLCQLRGWPQ